MFALSWMLSFIPSAIWALLLYGSLAIFAATYFLKFIKPLAIYAHIIRPISLVIAFFCVYWLGGLDVEERWQAKVKEVEAKVVEKQPTPSPVVAAAVPIEEVKQAEPKPAK